MPDTKEPKNSYGTPRFSDFLFYYYLLEVHSLHSE